MSSGNNIGTNTQTYRAAIHRVFALAYLRQSSLKIATHTGIIGPTYEAAIYKSNMKKPSVECSNIG